MAALGTSEGESTPISFQPHTPKSGTSGQLDRVLREVGANGSNIPSSTAFDEAQTPKFVKPLRVVDAHRATVRDELPSMVELLHWRNPAASICAAALGSATCCAAHWMFSVAQPAPFLSGATTLLALMLGVNFFRGTFSQSWLRASTWGGSEFESFLISRSVDTIKFLMAVRDQLLCSEDPWIMLRTCLALSALQSLSHVVSFWLLAGVTWALAFICVPLRTQLHWLYTKVYSAGAEYGKVAAGRLRLDRVANIFWLGMLFCFICVISGFATRSLIVLSFLVFVRCHMSNDQVRAVQDSAFVRSVTENQLLKTAVLASGRVSERVGAFADDVLMSAMKSARKHWADDPESFKRD